MNCIRKNTFVLANAMLLRKKDREFSILYPFDFYLMYHGRYRFGAFLLFPISKYLALLPIDPQGLDGCLIELNRLLSDALLIHKLAEG